MPVSVGSANISPVAGPADPRLESRADARCIEAAAFEPDELALRAYLLCVSPVAFRVRLIFDGPDPLQRARFPHRAGVIRPPMTDPQAPER